MESAESCLVVSDLLHGSGSRVPSVPQRSCAGAGRAAALGREPGNAGQGAQQWPCCWPLRRGPRVGFGTELLCIGSVQAVELVLPCPPSREHPPSSCGWVGWDVAWGQGDVQISHCIPPKPQVRSIYSHPSASAFWRMQPGVVGLLCNRWTPHLAVSFVFLG